MLKDPKLQSSNLLSTIGIKWDNHQKFMEDSERVNDYNVNSKILESLDTEFSFGGKDKLFLMILEMREYGFTLEDIATSLACEIDKLTIFYDEFSSILANYKAIGFSMNRIRKLSVKEQKKLFRI